MVRVMKAIIIVGDGMADMPLEELDYLTPLEKAEVRNMDWLASNGVSGQLYTALHNAVPESDTANLAILGYNPDDVYAGRGGFEAVGAGMQLTETDVAFRCDFATVDENFMVVNERLSTNVFTSPPKLGCQADVIKPLDNSVEAKRTCMALREIMMTSYSLLRDHPINRRRRSAGRPAANIIIPWGTGKVPHLQPFHEKFKLKAACVAAASLIKGIAKLAGMTVVNVPGVTGEIDTDTMAKARAALEALKSHDVVFVHVGGPDEASHDGDVYGKISIIKKIDAMVGLILEHVNLDETCFVLLADHVTSTKLRRHVSDPAPITIAGASVTHDGVFHYSETAAGMGGLGRIQHEELMPILLNLIRC